MLYFLFIVLAIGYNLKKFRKERDTFLSSIKLAKNTAHREMILGHHFYIFIFEAFLALIVAHLVTERAMAGGLLLLGFVYLCLLFVGFYLYQFFIRYVEKHTHLELLASFRSHLIKELRVNFAVIMLPILIYSLLNWVFQESVYEEWGSLWFIGLLFNILFVSVLTVVCSVIIMLRLIPNREITEPEYLSIINRRLAQIQQPAMRIRWIETDIKNAFVVGLNLLSFSNQTMFIGRTLRTTLSLDEFDAVIAHELAHVANRHIHKRILDLLRNFVSVIIGVGLLLTLVIGVSILYWGEDSYLHTFSTTAWSGALTLSWVIFNYALLFDTLRSHEYEADGYAVIEMGASFEALKSALEKLTTPEELPEYLRQLRGKTKERKFLPGWFSGLFSTHPELSARLRLLEKKINERLPFNYYVSTAKKIRIRLGHLLNWRISVPICFLIIFSIVMTSMSYKRGEEVVSFINRSSPEEIIENDIILKQINTKPLIVGQTLMYYVVKKKNEGLIDYYLKRGADKGKTLIYISLLKDFSLLQKYYARYQGDLTEGEYFLILRKTAQLNFTEGYRLLVNAKQFEELNPDFKQDVARLHDHRSRAPASVPSK